MRHTFDVPDSNRIQRRGLRLTHDFMGPTMSLRAEFRSLALADFKSAPRPVPIFAAFFGARHDSDGGDFAGIGESMTLRCARIENRLAFARRQSVPPQVTDVSTPPKRKIGAPHRSLGEHAEQHLALSPDVWLVKIRSRT